MDCDCCQTPDKARARRRRRAILLALAAVLALAGLLAGSPVASTPGRLHRDTDAALTRALVTITITA